MWLSRPHMWLNPATSATNGDDQLKYARLRDALADLMTSEQIAEAKRLARNWRPKVEGYQPK
jgi:hypothetical protein